MEKALLALLLSDTALAGLVRDRINWLRSPQGSDVPRVVLYRISGLRDTTMDGPSGLVSSRVQVDCIGKSYESAKATAQAVEKCLSGFRDLTLSSAFQGCFLIGERDDFEDTNTPDKLFRTSLDFNIWHKEH